jgi:hypothetical protein
VDQQAVLHRENLGIRMLVAVPISCGEGQNYRGTNRRFSDISRVAASADDFSRRPDSSASQRMAHHAPGL